MKLIYTALTILLFCFDSVQGSNDWLAEAERLLTNELLTVHDSLQVDFGRVILTEPPTSLPVRVERLNPRKTRGGMVIDLHFADGSVQRLTCKIRTWARHWQVEEFVDRGVRLSPDTVTLHWVETTRQRQDLLSADDAPSRYESLRQLSPGDLLAHNNCRIPPLVHSGESVQLIVTNGPVQVRDMARAMRDACSGERVSVRSLTTGRILAGIVQQNGQVMLETR